MTCKLTQTEQTTLRKLCEAADDAFGALAQWLDDKIEEWEAEFAEKSEKWQEGDNGAQAQKRIDTLNAWRDALVDERQIDPEELA